MSKSKKKPLSTFDRIMQDPERKRVFDEGYQEFLLSEILLEIMSQEGISVRKLAEKAKLSPTIIQEIKSGKRENPTLASISNIFKSLGYSIAIKNSKQEYILT